MGDLADYLIQNDPNFRKARLPALYSDFRPQRTLNPDGYTANVSAWRSAITLLTTTPLLPSPIILSISASFPRSLEHTQYGQPLALGTALREAIAAGELVEMESFMNPPSIGWRIAKWTLGKVWGGDGLPIGRFVVVAGLEKAAASLGDKIEAKTVFDRVFTRTQFQSLFAAELIPGQKLSDEDLEVLLRFLSRDKKMIGYDGQTVRINGAGESSNITEQDSAIASIKELTAGLTHQITLLESRISELTLTAKNAIAKKNRITALACLKSKKVAESSLATRYATLTQLEEVANKIQQAADQVALVAVMESSTSVLESLNKNIGGAERVDSVMDRVREQMAETDEVAAILAEGVAGGVDEAAVDEELEALVEEERLREKAVEEERERVREEEALAKLGEMPAVPGQKERPLTPTSATGIGKLSMADSLEKTREPALKS